MARFGLIRMGLERFGMVTPEGEEPEIQCKTRTTPQISLVHRARTQITADRRESPIIQAKTGAMIDG